MNRKTSVREKLKAKLAKVESKLRKKPPVTAEQKLQARIDTLNNQAHELNAECSRLQQEAASFVTRAETTKAPEAPPDRDALFERDSKAPPSQYDAQLKAYTMLEFEFASFESQVQDYGKKLDKFVTLVGNLKKGHAEPGKPLDKMGHQV